MLDNKLTIKAREDVAWRMIENQVIIVDGRFDKVHTLNPVATSIWTKIQEESKVSSLVSELLNEYDIDKATLLQDLHLLLESFSTYHLLSTDVIDASDNDNLDLSD